MLARHHIRAFALAAVAMLAANAIAQDENLDSVIEASRSTEATPELQAQIQAAPPETSDKYELAAFYYQRAVAQVRLGN